MTTSDRTLRWNQLRQVVTFPSYRYILSMVLAAGTRIGPYDVGSPIGAGGMGEVYRARDTKLDRDVALKVLPDELAADVTSDGNRFLMLKPAQRQESGHLVMVENWFDELERLVPTDQ